MMMMIIIIISIIIIIIIIIQVHRAELHSVCVVPRGGGSDVRAVVQKANHQRNGTHTHTHTHTHGDAEDNTHTLMYTHTCTHMHTRARRPTRGGACFRRGTTSIGYDNLF